MLYLGESVLLVKLSRNVEMLSIKIHRTFLNGFLLMFKLATAMFRYRDKNWEVHWWLIVHRFNQCLNIWEINLLTCSDARLTCIGTLLKELMICNLLKQSQISMT